MCGSSMISFLILSFEVCLIFANTCPWRATVNITDGKKFGNSILKNGDIYSSDDYFNEDGTIYGCVCNIKRCIHKCCPLEDAILESRKCVKKEGFLPKVYGKINSTGLTNFHLAMGLGCKADYALDPTTRKNESFTILPDGRLFVPFDKHKVLIDFYCVEYSTEFENSTGGVVAFVCEDTTTVLINTTGRNLFICFICNNSR